METGDGRWDGGEGSVVRRQGTTSRWCDTTGVKSSGHTRHRRRRRCMCRCSCSCKRRFGAEITLEAQMQGVRKRGLESGRRQESRSMKHELTAKSREEATRMYFGSSNEAEWRHWSLRQTLLWRGSRRCKCSAVQCSAVCSEVQCSAAQSVSVCLVSKASNEASDGTLWSRVVRPLPTPEHAA